MRVEIRTCLAVFALASVVLAGGCRSMREVPEPGITEPNWSDFFANAGGRIVVQRLEGDAVELRYTLWLQQRNPGKRSMKLEVRFENPEDRSKPLVMTQDVAAGETAIEMTSPPIWGVKPDHDYEVIIRINNSIGQPLGKQRLFIRSLVDSRGLRRGGS